MNTSTLQFLADLVHSLVKFLGRENVDSRLESLERRPYTIEPGEAAEERIKKYQREQAKGLARALREEGLVIKEEVTE